MRPNASDFAGKSRQPVWERDLARQLRSLPEQERFQFLGDLLSVQPVVALELAPKCLSEKRYFEVLLERGLKEADASSIREWLKCVVSRLGVRRVRHLLGQLASRYPEGVRRAEYWMPEFQDARAA